MSTTIRLETPQPGTDAPETAAQTTAQPIAAASHLETKSLATDTPFLVVLERLAVGLLVIAALVLRMYTLSVTELNIDELGQVVAAQSDFQRTLWVVATHEGAAPLDYFVTAAMLTVGQDEATLRMPAAVWGALTVLVIYLLSRSMFGRAAAFVIAFILTILPLHVRYSQELRFYSLGALGVVSAAALFWYAQKRAKWWAWALYSLSLIVFLHAHYYVAFLAAALALWTLLFRRSQLLACWFFSFLALLAFLPWAYYDNVTVQTRGGVDLHIVNWTLPAGIGALWTGPFALGFVAPKWNLAGLEFGWGVEWVVRYAYAFWGLAAVSLVWLWFSRRRAALAMPLMVMSTMIVGLVLLDMIGNYRLFVRQLLLPAPFLIMAAIGALFDILGRLPGRRFVVPAAAAGVIAIGFLLLWPSVKNVYTSKASDGTLRHVAAFLHQNIDYDHTVVLAGPADRGIYYFQDIRAQVRGVYRRPLPPIVNGAAENSSVVWLVPWYGGSVGTMVKWAQENGAWNVTPWRRGHSIFVYSATDPEASLRAAEETLLSPGLSADARARITRRLADQLVARGRTEEARPYVEAALRHEGASAPLEAIPEDMPTDLLVYLANANLTEGTRAHLSRADTLFQRILAREPENFAANYYLAEQAVDAAEWERAEEILRATIAVRGRRQFELAKARRLQLIVYHELARTDDACNLWIWAHGRDERYHREMVASMEEWMQENEPCEDHLLADRLRKQGAAAPLDEIPEDAPIDLLIDLGNANFAEGTPEHLAKADILFRRVLEHEPTQFDANYYLAEQAANSGEWEKAEEILSAAMAVKGRLQLQLARGRRLQLIIYHELRRTDEACDLWVWVRAQNERYHQEMVASMEEWMQEHEPCEDHLRFDALRSQGAAAPLDAIPEDAPTDLLIYLGNANFSEGTPEHLAKAEEIFLRVLERNPTEFAANYFFAEQAANVGEWEEAEEILRDAMAVQGLSQFQLARGRRLFLMVYHALERAEDACNLWAFVQGINERRHIDMVASMADWVQENLTCASGDEAGADDLP